VVGKGRLTIETLDDDGNLTGSVTTENDIVGSDVLQTVELGNGSRVAFIADDAQAEKVARQFKGKVKPTSRRAAIASTFEDLFEPDPQQTTGDEWDF